jgi:uncharacterized membrane protein YccF (DUF307 family)
MNLIGNIIWVIFGGWFIALEYFIGGLILCCTIVGIPFGVKVMRLGLFALWPFGGKVVSTERISGCLVLTLNALWIIFGGLAIVFSHLTLGVLFCITIIGIPFGKQHFKLMTLSLLPFGQEVIRN